MNQHYLNPNFLKISLFFLIVIFPLSLASGSGVININTILISSIILFYISMGAKKGSTIPILEHGHHDSHAVVVHHSVDAALYANPLTQILMLTAIVVGVGTLGVALSLIQKIYSQHHSVDEDKVLEKVNS